MSEWIEDSWSNTVGAAQTAATPVRLFSNDEVSRDVPRTVVDGYVTIITNSDDLCQVRLFGPAAEFADPSDFTFLKPARKEFISWYWLNCGRGPMVFRIRSKRTFSRLEECWGVICKLRGATTTEVHVGWQLLLSP